ncbi:hypothetical protein EXIGLDRAFT_765222 [Exidia glandulosa HHB12029]|uniref:Zn(2)-C6 fungal-type domain-containing protein n=1 Tax=Exidia glandulosa HHB12029 TaxID=1314781 RepID=A0A165KLZ5_EXIGL|nr:hypothetical protein EXIGLDRAFT_765222 [Exidia glandulosa HHB12029]
MNPSSSEQSLVGMTGYPLACAECANDRKGCDSPPVLGDNPHKKCSRCVDRDRDCTPRYSQGRPTPTQLREEITLLRAEIRQLYQDRQYSQQYIDALVAQIRDLDQKLKDALAALLDTVNISENNK